MRSPGARVPRLWAATAMEGAATLRRARGAWSAAIVGYSLVLGFGAIRPPGEGVGGVTGPILWVLALTAFIGAGTDLVGADLRTGAVFYWIQRRRAGTGFYLRRLAVRAGLFLTLLGATFALLQLGTRTDDGAAAVARMHAIVMVSVLPLFASVFLLSCAAVRHEAAAGIVHALIVSPPLLVVGERAPPAGTALLQTLAYPWVQLDVIATAIASGGALPLPELGMIAVWATVWIGAGSWLLARRLSRL